MYIEAIPGSFFFFFQIITAKVTLNVISDVKVNE